MAGSTDRPSQLGLIGQGLSGLSPSGHAIAL